MIRAMSDWRARAEITADVVLFRYVSDPVERLTEEVYIWDLDKTYLDTTFETFRGLWRTAMEKAFQKQNIPGTSTLVRALRNHWQEIHRGEKDFPIYFITGSPPQLEPKIHEKLNFDGIYPFGLFCKDNLQNLRPSRMWRLTQQVGFKLQSLLQLRLHLGDDIRQILWGDDSELDAIIYCLYSDLCARRLDEKEIRNVLKYHKVTGQQVDTILRLLADIPIQDPVEKIYINLASDTDAEYYLKFGRRILPTSNSFQLALDLFQDRRLSALQVAKVAKDLLENYNFSPEDLEASIDDLVRRPALAATTLEEILPALREQGLVSKTFECSVAPKTISARNDLGRVVELGGITEPWIPPRINYLWEDR
jgi:hypothetical protein